MGGIGMTEFSPQEISRYRRQLSLAGFGKDAQAKLRDSHVAVIGAGGDRKSVV